MSKTLLSKLSKSSWLNIKPSQGSSIKPSISAPQSGRVGLPAAIHRRRITATLSSLTLLFSFGLQLGE
jgi:hypothetical protein